MEKPRRGGPLPIIILGVFFFIFGFVTWLNGTLIPYLKIACELESDLKANLVAFAFYISYFVMALPSSWVLERTGFKKGMMLGLVVMAVGALVFIPAARTREYGLFLGGLFVIGTGLSLLQTAANPYVTIIGPMESAAKRISIMGICNKVAGVLAPIALGAVVLHDADLLESELLSLVGPMREARLDELAARVIMPYSIMAGVLLGLAFLVRFSPLPEIEAETGERTQGEEVRHREVLRHPRLMLGVLALFLYVGVEVIAGDTIGRYAQTQGVPLSEAKHFTSYTLAAMVIGYLLGIVAIPKWISQRQALAGSAITGVLLSVAALLLTGTASVLAIAMLGLANALVWPAIWPLALEGLGRLTKTGSALLIMAIAGGALLPLLYGGLADLPSIGNRYAYIVLVPSYLFILYYALTGRERAGTA